MSSPSSPQGDNKSRTPTPERASEPGQVSIPPASASLYRCRFCPLAFSTHMALGGHQNAHRRERDAEKTKAESSKNASNFPILESSGSSMGSTSRLWADQFPVARQMMFSHLSAPTAPPVSFQSFRFGFSPPPPMASSASPRTLNLFPSAPVAPSQPAPSVPAPPPAFMAPPPPVGLPPAGRRPVLHNFFGPGVAEEEEEEDLNLDLTL